MEYVSSTYVILGSPILGLRSPILGLPSPILGLALQVSGSLSHLFSRCCCLLRPLSLLLSLFGLVAGKP